MSNNLSKKSIKMGEEIIANSLLAWVREERIKNEKGELIEFIHHRFLLDIYKDDSKEIVLRKSSQTGGSTWAILDELHDAIYSGINQIHTLPTASDVGHFVPGKVNQIIRMNPCIGENMTKGDVDAVTQKQIGKSFLYFRGTFMERAAIMLTSDKNIYDEVDKSNQEVIRDYTSRLGFSKIGRKVFISTPTVPDFGIDKLWNDSDQKYWRFDCPHCGFRQHMEWEKNVDFDKEIYVCQECRKELIPKTIQSGKWEARYPGRAMSGYWISQMMVTWRTAKDLIKEQEDAEDEQYFYNFVLGLPYLNPENKIPASLILRNLTNKENDERDAAMGVDIGGKDLHVIIGNKKGIFGIAKIIDQPGKKKWKRLEELMEVYEVRYCVIDGTWNTNEAYEFAAKFPYKVYLNWYKEDPKRVRIVRFADEAKFTDKHEDFEEEIKVLSDRNRIIDALISDLRRNKFQFNFLSGDDRIIKLIEHVQTMYARTVTDKVGTERREWVSTTKMDHFLHAMVYYKIAYDKKLRNE